MTVVLHGKPGPGHPLPRKLSKKIPTSASDGGDDDNVELDFGKASKASLFATAALIVEEKAASSQFFGKDTLDRIPRFNYDELRMGRVLGRGGFCVVTEIEKVKIPEMPHRKGGSFGSNSFTSMFSRAPAGSSKSSHMSTSEIDLFSNPCTSDAGSMFGGSERITPCSGGLLRQEQGGDLSSRGGIARLARKKNRKGRGYFALKTVSCDVYVENKLTYLKGLVDLALEAKFLAALDHPHIVSLCGVSHKGPSHFIMMERLGGTLSKKFSTWTTIDRQCKGITGMVTGSKRKEADLYETRIQVSLAIASALEYLHENNIIYRDLKPDNIGFDTKDRVKLFDFGLAKELFKHDRDEEGLYKLTGTTGSFRYMAPEVSLGERYNMKADVYSWSIIMWFILALEPPFGFYTEHMIKDRVHKRGSRPAIFNSWSEPLGNIMKRSWDVTIAARPSFAEIGAVLKSELRSEDPTCTSLSVASVALR